MGKIDRTPVSALLISDGRPGHFRLGEGILATIARQRPTHVRRMELRRPKWIPPRMLARLTNGGCRPENILRYIYGVNAEDIPNVDLIVSAGGDTLAANVAIKKMLGDDVKNIFYGSLRSYRPEDFSVVLTSNTSQTDRANHFLTLKPSDIDNAPLEALLPSDVQRDHRRVPRHVGLIVGGPTGTIVYNKQDWDALFSFVAELHRRHGTRWTLANAPRTPKEISDRMAAMAATPSFGVDNYIDVRVMGPGSLKPLFTAVEAVVCTADSSSGVSEAVWAHRACIAAMPASYALSENEQEYRRWLSNRKWTRDIPIAELSPDRFMRAYHQIEPLEGDPFEQLAGQLKTFLPNILAAA